MSEKMTETTLPVYAEPYCVHDNCLCLTKTVKRQTIYITLCNCAPYIVSELTVFENGETTRYYRIAGFDRDGNPLPEVDVPAKEFGTLKWMDNAWPAACAKTAASSVEKHIEYAVKTTGDKAEHHYVYAYTGWTNLGGKYSFLLPGNPDYEVILHGKQTGYAMAADCPDAAIEVLFGMLLTDRLPQEVIYPCLALVFLSPLNEFLRLASYEPKFILTLVGRTGSMKSTLAALLLSFFGKFTATDLPMSFRDTANSLLYNAAALKDVLACVDDYHPSTKKDSEDMNKSMQMLARGYGDRATRERLTSDIQIRDTPQPRGNLIVTAEFPPDIGESGAARLFIVETPQGGMDLEMLSYFQRQAHDGVLMQCMYGYLSWLQSSFLSSEETVSRFVSTLENRYVALRTQWISFLRKKKLTAHNRLPDTLACLSIGFQTMLWFLQSREVLTDESRLAYLGRFDAILEKHAAKQCAAVQTEKPTVIFIRKLIAMIESGQAALLDAERPGIEIPKGFIGYEDEHFYYLCFEEAHKRIKQMCDAQHEAFGISSKALAKQLAVDGLIEVSGDGKNTRTYRFGSVSKRVMFLKKEEAEKIIRDEE